MRRRSLRFEPLERRLLLAGDVNVTFGRGNLNITGDGSGNQIEIEYVAPNTFRVTGNDGTTLGGSNAPIEFPGVNSIRVNMREGNNHVEIRGTVAQPFVVARDLRIQSGRGDDVIIVERATIGGQLNISTPGGNNHAAVLRTNVTGNLTVSTGNGAEDRIAVAGGTARNVSLNGGNSGRRAALGDAEIAVTGITIAGGLTIRTGVGDDEVGVGYNVELIKKIQQNVAAALPAGTAFSLEDAAGPVTVTGSVSITTSNGNDQVLIEQLTAPTIRRGGFTINAGNGDNQVGVVDSTIQRNINITTGSGNDLIGLVDVRDAANITVRSGHGDGDRIGLAGVQATNVNLDGGNSGRRAQHGTSEIGITASTIANNLTIRTGVGDDMVAVGDHPDLDAMMQKWKGSATLDVPTGEVRVGSNVNIATNNGDDGVWIQGLKGTASVSINTGNGDDEIGIIDSEITGNITINTGNSTGGGGDKGDQVGMIRVTAGNLTVNNSLGNAGFGLAHVNAANVTLNGGNSVNRRNANFGPAVIGVTNSTLANLTIRQGHPPDGVVVGIHEDFETYFQIPDPASEDDDMIDYDMGPVNVAGGTVSITSNTPGRFPGGDVVRISHLQARVLRVNTGRGDDELTLGEGMNVTQEFTVRMGSNNDTLLLDVADPAAFVASLPANREINGDSGTNTLKKNNEPQPLDALFKNWQNIESL